MMVAVQTPAQRSLVCIPYNAHYSAEANGPKSGDAASSRGWDYGRFQLLRTGPMPSCLPPHVCQFSLLHLIVHVMLGLGPGMAGVIQRVIYR